MPYTPTTTIVQELADYLSENPEFKAAFEESLLLAIATGIPELGKFGIDSIDGYLKYMDEYVHWVPSEDVTGTNVYYHLCTFYFILDLPPVLEHQSPIDPSSQSPWRWLSEWLIRYAKEMGNWMDMPSSITGETLATFVNCPKFRDPEAPDFYDQYPEPAGGWQTFNEFFGRAMNLEKYRPLASPLDSTVIVSPADCTFDGVWPINDETADVTTFDVKGVPWTIAQLLDDEALGTDYGSQFAGGTFTHSFLGPTDYHRQHAPVSGVVVEAKVIPGLCYLEVVLKKVEGTSGSRLGMHRKLMRKKDDPTIISPHALAARASGRGASSPGDELVPDAPDSPGYQFIQARGLILIDSDVGLVAVLPIGMAQVSSVMLTVKPGDRVEKGDEISRFQFGGSDLVMVFQKGADVKLDQEKGVHYKVRSQVGTGKLVKNNDN